MVLGLVWDILIGAPSTLFKEVIKKVVAEIAGESLMTEESVKMRLQQLLLALDAGQITIEEYEQLEAGLMDRLRALRR